MAVIFVVVFVVVVVVVVAVVVIVVLYFRVVIEEAVRGQIEIFWKQILSNVEMNWIEWRRNKIIVGQKEKIS